MPKFGHGKFDVSSSKACVIESMFMDLLTKPSQPAPRLSKKLEAKPVWMG